MVFKREPLNQKSDPFGCSTYGLVGALSQGVSELSVHAGSVVDVPVSAFDQIMFFTSSNPEIAIPVIAAAALAVGVPLAIRHLNQSRSLAVALAAAGAIACFAGGCATGTQTAVIEMPSPPPSLSAETKAAEQSETPQEKAVSISQLIGELDKGVRKHSGGLISIPITEYPVINKLIDAGERAIPSLLGAIKDNPSDKVKENAIKALNGLKVYNEEIGAILMPSLSSADIAVKVEAAKILVREGIKTGPVVTALLEAVQAGKGLESWYAINLLEEIGPGDPRITPTLFEVLKTTDDTVIKWDLIMLLTQEGFATPQTRAYIESLKTDPDDYLTRAGIAMTMSENKELSSDQIDRLMQFTLDEHRFVRIAAVSALGQVGVQQPEWAPVAVPIRSGSSSRSGLLWLSQY